jgi:tetratricopeptide (TPR) repeat protein/DNA-binding CsgD family transcriptional regulator
MKKFLFISLLLFSLKSYSQTQDSILVSLENEIEIAKNDSLKVKAMLALGEYHLDKNFSKAKFLIHEAFSILQKEENKNNLNALANAYSLKGIISRREGHLVQSLDNYFKSKTIYEQLKDSINISSLFHNMGMVHRYNKDYRKSIPFYQQSIAIKNRLGNQTYEIASSYNMMGVSYKGIKKRDSALWCYTKAIDLFTSIHKEEDVYRAKNNIANLYRINKEYEKALAIYFESNAYYQKKGNILSTSNSFYNISTVYKDLKQYATAMTYADSSLSISKAEGLKDRISKAYLRKSFLYAKLDNFKEAYNYYRLFNKTSDSLFNIENIKKLQELELTHEFEQEKLELELEKKRVEVLAKAETSKKKLYLLLFILALLSAGIIWFLVRKIYKGRAVIISEKLEKEEIQKELLSQKVKIKEGEIKSLIADNSMRSSFKEELLQQLKSKLTNDDLSTLKQSLDSLIKDVQSQINTEGKLSLLQSKIDEVNEGFEAKLRTLYPELTKTEREICNLLRLNLSIKEMMTIRGASLDAIKSVRYRIRKKMALSPKEELEQFIQNL